MGGGHHTDVVHSRREGQAGCLSGFGLIACGPILFVVIFLAVVIITYIPFILFGLDMPEWLFWPLGAVALVLTIAAVIGISANRVQEEKGKKLIREAELKRAKDELER